MYRTYRPYKFLLIAGDAIITLLMLMALFNYKTYLWGHQTLEYISYPFWMIYIVNTMLWHILFTLTGVYDYSRLLNLNQFIGRYNSTYLVSIFVFAGFIFFINPDISRLLVLYYVVFNYLALLGFRLIVIRLLRRRSRRGNRNRVLILGLTELSVNIANTIINDENVVFQLAGFVDNSAPEFPAPAPYLGKVKDLQEIVRTNNIRVVIIAWNDTKMSDLRPLVHALDPLPVSIFLAPNFQELSMIDYEIQCIGDLFLIGLREPAIRGPRRVSKRILDIVLSIVALLTAWPLFLLIAIAIKLDSKGPVFYSSTRVGENGDIFRMMKFRSMYANAEEFQEKLVTYDAKGLPIYKTSGDPRITRVGKFIRRTSLDELPQIFNVLKGEMSWVGPRPEQPHITANYKSWQWQRVSVPPGITGWWQVSGRSDLPLHLNTHFDLYYIRNYSIFFDLRIILMTVKEVLSGRGAY